MKPLSWIGLILIVLGILAFVVPVPHSESHGVKVGDASVGITTKSNEKLPPVVGGILCAAGVVALVVGSRK
jgi:drug/metabolite transporter (DMT)-like permease